MKSRFYIGAETVDLSSGKLVEWISGDIKAESRKMKVESRKQKDESSEIPMDIGAEKN